MNASAHKPIALEWFQRSAGEIQQLDLLCKEWQQPPTGFWSLDQVLKSFSEPGVRALSAKLGKDLVGFLLFQVIPGFSELLYVYVRQESRKLGVSRLLMERYFQYLESIPDCSMVFLEVRESNESARALYERLGFVKYGVRKGYYSNGDNAINYRRPIGQGST